MLQGWAPAEPPRPQYYHVACDQGHPLQGQRTEGYQALRCPTCGEGIFVLPRSPLPDPPAPKARTRPVRAPIAPVDEGPVRLTDPPPSTQPPPPEEAEADIEWLDPADADPAKAPPQPQPPARPPRPPPPRGAAPAAAPPP